MEKEAGEDRVEGKSVSRLVFQFGIYKCTGGRIVCMQPD